MGNTTVVCAVTINRTLDDREREALSLRVMETLVDEFPDPEDCTVTKVPLGDDPVGLLRRSAGRTSWFPSAEARADADQLDKAVAALRGGGDGDV